MPEPGKTDHWKSLLDFIGVPTGQGGSAQEPGAEQPRLDADIDAPASEAPVIKVTPPSRPPVAERAKTASPKPAPRPKPTRSHWSKLAGALGLEVPPEPEPEPEPTPAQTPEPVAVARPPREEARPTRDEARPAPAGRQSPEPRSQPEVRSEGRPFQRRPAADAPASPSAFDKRNALDDMFLESPQSLDVFALAEGREEPRRETKRREPEPIEEYDDLGVDLEIESDADADLPLDDDAGPTRSGGAEPASEDDRGPRRRRRRRGRGRGRGRDEARPESPPRKDQPTVSAPLDDLDDLDEDFEAAHGLDDLEPSPGALLDDAEEPLDRGREERGGRGGRRRRGRGRGRTSSEDRPAAGRESGRSEATRSTGRTEGTREGARSETIRSEDARSDSAREGGRGEGGRGEGGRGEGGRGEGGRGSRSEGARGEGTRGEGTRGEGTRGERGRGDRSRQRTEARPAAERRSRDEDDLEIIGPASRSSVSQHADDADMEDEGGGEHSIHRRIPTWQEAVGLLVDANMASRAANPERGGGRGRGGRGGGRGGRGGGRY